MNNIGNNSVINNKSDINMKKIFIKKIKGILETQKSEILSRVENSKLNEIDEGTGEDIDAVQARIIALATKQLAERDKLNIKKIDGALKRIENDEYGICAQCSEEIDEKRLLINPAFAVCVVCSEKNDLNKRKFGG